MSNKKNAATEETTAIATVEPRNVAMAVAEGFDKDDHRGKENLDSGDVTLPFLALAQKTSPQVEPDDAKFIVGLNVGDFFNSITGEIYGPGPLEFVPIVLKKHAIEFEDFDNGGGIKDRNVQWDDDRCKFQGDDKPLATRFYDWAVLLVPSMELIVLSMKSTNIAVAKQFQQIVQMRPGAVFAGKYRLTSKSAQVSTGGKTITFKKMSIQPAGAPSAEEASFAGQIFESFQKRDFVTNHEAETERTPGSDDGQVAADKKIPF